MVQAFRLTMVNRSFSHPKDTKQITVPGGCRAFNWLDAFASRSDGEDAGGVEEEQLPPSTEDTREMPIAFEVVHDDYDESALFQRRAQERFGDAIPADAVGTRVRQIWIAAIIIVATAVGVAVGPSVGGSGNGSAGVEAARPLSATHVPTTSPTTDSTSTTSLTIPTTSPTTHCPPTSPITASTKLCLLTAKSFWMRLMSTSS
jgi:hypothetical protein